MPEGGFDQIVTTSYKSHHFAHFQMDNLNLPIN